MSGATTRKEIIEDDAIIWGKDYATYVQQAVDKNKEFVASILAMNEANKSVKSSSNTKELAENQKRYNEVSEKSITIWKEQNQLELALISTKKKNELATESTNRALVKERTLLAETNKSIKQQAREQLGLVGSMERLNKARNEAQKKLGDLLSAEQKSTKEIARATIEFEKLDARIKGVDAAIKNYSKNIGNYQGAFDGLRGTLSELTSAFGVVTGIALFGSIIKDSFNVIKEFDRQLIAVGKTTNISGDELKDFGREVVALGGQLDGVSINGLISSAEVAGQLGVTGTENILKFSTAIEKLKLTSNIISDDQVGQFAKFIEVSQDSFENADRLASVITRLGNEMATTEAEVLSNSTEIQKGVSVYNASAQSVLALGAATSTLGNEAEVSASSIQKGFGVINNAVATGKNLQEVLKLTGLTQKELSKQFNADATGTFVKFVKGLSDAKKEGQNLAVVLKSVELDEVRTFKTIGSLAANYGVLEAAMASASEEYKVNTALNKEVAAASESVASILTDIKDKWEQYILNTNDANGGTEKLANGLKFLRDNLQSIISNIIKYGTVLLVFLGIQKAVSFATSVFTALKIASTAAQIRFAIATGIGTEKILLEAAAVRSAAIAQGQLNVAMTATPWGIVLAAVSALVAAYIIFNDQLSETEIRVNAVKYAISNVNENEKFYSGEREKNHQKNMKNIEDEIALREAKGENSDKLYKEEISLKNSSIDATLNGINLANQGEKERTKTQIIESDKRVAQYQKELEEFNKKVILNPFAPKEYKEDKVANIDKAITDSEVLKAKLQALNESDQKEVEKYAKIKEDLNKNLNIKNAEMQAEADKKAIEARKKRNKELYELEKKRADDEFKLGQFRLQVAIDLDKELSDNENGQLDTRITALLDGQQLYEAKVKEQAVRELQLLGKYNEDAGKFIRELSDLQISEVIRTGKTSENLTNAQQLIYETYQNNLTLSTKKGKEDRKKLIDGQVDLIQRGIDSQNQESDSIMNDRLTRENELYKASLDAAKNNFELVEAATLAHERRILKITQEANQEKLQNQIDTMQIQLDNNAQLPVAEQISADKRQEIENKLSQYRLELSQLNVDSNKLENDSIVELTKQKSERLLELEKESSERTRELAQNLASSLVDLTNTIFDARIAGIDAEIQAVNDSYDTQIEAAGNDARQKDLLEKEKLKKTKELEKERKKELIKAAIFNKIISLAQVGLDLAKTITAINLAAAEMDALAAFLFGGAGAAHRGIQIPLAIGTAAAQSAVILATPLPKYKEGTKNHKGGPALVGEVRPEVIIEPGMDPYIIDRPSIVDLKKHSQVIPSIPEYEKLMRASVMASLDIQLGKVNEYQASLIFNDRYSKEILEELKRNTEAVKRQKKSKQSNSKTIDLNHEFWKRSITKWHN